MGFRDRVSNFVTSAKEPAKAGSLAMSAGQVAVNHGANDAITGASMAGGLAVGYALSKINEYNGAGADTADFHEPRDITDTPSGVEVRWRR